MNKLDDYEAIQRLDKVARSFAEMPPVPPRWDRPAVKTEVPSVDRPEAGFSRG